MYPMVGLIPADGFSGEKLSRFGYVILERSQWATDLLEEKCSWEEGASYSEKSIYTLALR